MTCGFSSPLSLVCVRLCAQAEKLRQAGQLSRKEFIQMIGRTSSSSVLRCQGLDLRTMNLSHLDLQSVNFSHADLRHCNLSGANLANCCMEYANLEGATLDVSGFMANLSMNIIMVCNVIGCPGAVVVCCSSTLKGAILQCVNLSKTNLDRASMKGCNFDKRLGNVTHMVGE